MITYITKYSVRFSNPTVEGDEKVQTMWKDFAPNLSSYKDGEIVTKQVLSKESAQIVRKYMMKQKFEHGRRISHAQAIKEITA